MADEILGYGRIVVEVQENVKRDLEKVEKQVEATMRDIDRQKASIELDANLKPLQEAVDKAEKKVAEYKAKVEKDADLGLDTSKAERNLKTWEKKLHERRSERDEITLDTSKARAQLAKLQKLEERAAAANEKRADARIVAEKKVADAIEAQRKRTAKAIADAEFLATESARKASDERRKIGDRARKAEVDAENKRIRTAVKSNLDYQRTIAVAQEKAYKEDDRRSLAAWKSADKMHKEQAKAAHEAITVNERNALSVAQLNRQYVEAARTLRKLRNTKTPFVAEKKQKLEMDTAFAEAQLARVAAELKALGAIEPEIHFNFEKGLRGKAEQSVRKNLDRLQNMGNVAVRIGPLTASLRGFMKSLIALGPIVTGLVGSLSALVGVTGAGLVGAMTVAGGSAVGLGLAFGGMFLAVKPVVSEMNNAIKASAALDKALREHGKGSEEYAKKLDIYNNVMKHQTAETKENYLAGGRMVGRWKELTKASRTTAFETVGKAIKFAGDNMGWFAEKTNTATKAVGDGLVKWMDRLNSQTGRNTLGGIFDSFNTAIPHIMASLGNLAAYLGKVFNVGGRAGATMFESFEKWTERLNNNFRESPIKGLIADAKTLGQFLVASGRALRTFFGAGRKAGGEWLADMTTGLNDWSDRMSKNETLQKFFKDATANTRAFLGALAPVAVQFVSWSSALMPVVTALLSGVGVFFQWGAAALRLAEGMGRFVGLSGALSTMAATLGVMWGIGKVAAFLTVLGRVVTMFKAVAVAAGLAKTAMVVGFEARSVGVGIAAAATQMTAMKAATAGAAATATTATGRFAALGGAGAAFGPVGMAVAAAATAAGIGFVTLANNSNKWIDRSRASTDAAQANAEAFDQLKDSMRGTTDELARAYGSKGDTASGARAAEGDVRSAQRELNKLRRDGKKDTDEYIAAEQRLDDAIRNRTRARYDEQAAEQTRIDTLKKLRSEAKDAITAANADLKDAQKGLKQMDTYEVGGFLDRATSNESQFKNVVTDMQDIAKGGQDAAEAMGRLYLRGGEVADVLSKMKPGTDLKTQLEALVEAGGRSGKAAKQYLTALNEQEAAQKRIADAENQKVLGEVNAARAAKGFFQISQSAAQAFGDIERAAGRIKGKKITNTIATRYEGAKDAGRVGRQAAAALKSGAKTSLVMRIVADSRNADIAVERLKRTKIPDKFLDIVEKGGKKAVMAIEAINGRRLKKKDAEIAEKGGAKALAMIDKVDKKRVKDKPFVVRAIDAATGLVNNLLQKLAGLKDKTVNITTNLTENVIRKRSGGAAMGAARAAATGGAGNSFDRMQARAADRAARKNTQVTKGGEYKTPTLLVGEENRSEYVIATNPAYRDRNMAYLGQAAKDFGMQLVDGAAKGKGKLKYPKGAFKVGAVDWTNVKKKRDDFTRWATQREKDLETKKDALKAAERKRDRWKGKKSGTTWDNLQDRIGVLTDQVGELREGRDGQNGRRKSAREPQKYGIKQLHKQEELWKGRFDKVDAIKRDLEKHRDIVDTQRSKMEEASTRYDAAKTPEDREKYKGDWQTAKNAREAAIKHIKGLYDAAVPLSTGAYKRQLQKDQAAAGADLAESETSEAPTFEPPEVSLDDVLKQYSVDGKSGKDRLDEIENAIANAKVATPQTADNPATEANELADSLTDDKAAAQSAVDFYQGLYNRYQNDATIPMDVRTEIAEALSGARSDLQGLNDEISGAASDAATANSATAVDNARADILREYGSNYNPNISQAGAAGLPGGGLQDNQSSTSDPAITSPAGRSSLSRAVADGTASGLAASGGIIGGRRASGFSGLRDPRSMGYDGSGMQAGGAASRMMARRAAMSGAGGSYGGGAMPQAPSKTVNVVNNISTPQVDPHSMSAGFAFELGSMV